MSGVIRKTIAYALIVFISIMNILIIMSQGTGYAAATDIIIDNTDSGFTTDSPTWLASTSTPGYYGSNYVHDNNSLIDPNKWAKWTPNIAEVGTYNIYMKWTSGTNRPNAVPVEVQYNGGKDTSKTINQQQNNGTWVLIGTYNLSSGTGNYVKVLCTSPGYTIADAVKFEKVKDTQAPAAPTNLTSTSKTNKSVTLSWVAPTDVDVTGYEVYNGTSLAGTTNITSFTVTGLTAGTTYSFTVKAKDAAGNLSLASNAVSITTGTEIIVDNTDSGFVTDSLWKISTLTSGYYGTNYSHDNNQLVDPNKWAKWTPNITEAGSYNVYMRWTAGPDRPNAVPLEIQYNGGKDTTKTVNQQQNNGVWMLLGTYKLSAGTGNYVKLLCKSYGYTIADAVKFEKVPDNQAANAPTNLVCTAKTESTATLQWTAPLDSTGLIEYEIFEAGASVGRVNTGTTYMVNGLMPGSAHTFTVRAKYSDGKLSGDSNSVTVETNPDTQAPTAPTELKTYARHDTSLTITWKPSSDNAYVKGYEVYRNGIKTGTATDANYTDIGLTKNTAYSYMVKAYDGDGNISTESNALNITTLDDDHGNDKTEATPLELGKELAGVINYGGDQDWFVYKADWNGRYHIESTGSTDT